MSGFMWRRICQLQRNIRFYSTEVAKEIEKPIVQPIKKKQGSSLGQRLSAFAVGLATGGGYSLFIVKKDLEKSNQEIQDAISSLKADFEDHQESLNRRLAQVEKKSS